MVYNTTSRKSVGANDTLYTTFIRKPFSDDPSDAVRGAAATANKQLLQPTSRTRQEVP